MELTSILLASIGIMATVFVSWLVYVKSGKILKIINAILIARITPEEFNEFKKLIEDIERTGEKRGTIVQKQDGAWGINWNIGVGGGTIKPSGSLGRRLIK